MKVTDMVTTLLSIPLEHPVKNGIPISKANPVIVQLNTDEGLEGIGMAFTFNDQRVKSLKACIDDLKEIISQSEDIDTSVLDSAPEIVRQSLLFPYEAGFPFVLSLSMPLPIVRYLVESMTMRCE